MSEIVPGGDEPAEVCEDFTVTGSSTNESFPFLKADALLVEHTPILIDLLSADLARCLRDNNDGFCYV